jgi:hypothetical protein
MEELIKAEKLATKIDQTDRTNELSRGAEMNVSVEYEEQIPAKTENILRTLGQLLCDPQAKDAKKVFEDHLDGVLAKAEAKLKNGEMQDDIFLQNLVSEAIDELDNLFESIVDKKAASERAQFVTEFLEKNPEFRAVKMNLNNTDAYTIGGENYYWFEIFKLFELKYAQPEESAENKKKDVEHLSKIVAAVGVKSAMRAVDAIGRKGYRDEVSYLKGLSRIGEKCVNLAKYLKPEELTAIINSAGEGAGQVLNYLEDILSKGIVVKNPILFAKKLEIIVRQDKAFDDFSIPYVLNAARTEEEYLHLLSLSISDKTIRGSDLALLIQEKHVDIMKLTPDQYLVLLRFNVSNSWSPFSIRGKNGQDYMDYLGAIANYRLLFKNFKLEELIEATKILNGRSFSNFMGFLTNCKHLLKGSNVVELAKEYKKAEKEYSCDSNNLSEIYLSIAENWQEAFEILSVLSEAGNDKLKSIELLMPRLCKIDNLTIIERKGFYAEIAARLEANDAILKAAAENIIDFQGLSNSRKNRYFLESLSPVFLSVYDEQRAKLRFSKEIVPDEEPPIKDFKIGKKDNVSTSDKIKDRDCAYMARRMWAYVTEVDDIDLSKLEVKVEEKKGIKYESYLENDDELFVLISAPSKRIGIFYSKTNNRDDSPLSKVAGAILEVTGGMVLRKDLKTPTDLISVDGEAINPNMHPSHDGIIIVDESGNISVQNIEAISGITLGLGETTVNGRGDGMSKFAEAVQYKHLSVMQGPMVINNGEELVITQDSVPWYKRAFVEFSDGKFGFFESSKPMGNIEFTKLMVNMKVKNAILLDTGSFDNYRDVNGHRDRKAPGFNPVMMYVK